MGWGGGEREKEGSGYEVDTITDTFCSYFRAHFFLQVNVILIKSRTIQMINFAFLKLTREYT